MQTQYKITTEANPSGGSITLSLNGKFSEDALPELEQTIVEARNARQQIYIDLSEVTLVDRKAVDFISERAGRDIKVVNCPVYLRHWIRQGCDETES